MPYKEREIEKMYYTIGEVAKKFNVNTSHIRFWSKHFDAIQPKTELPCPFSRMRRVDLEERMYFDNFGTARSQGMSAAGAIPAACCRKNPGIRSSE